MSTERKSDRIAEELLREIVLGEFSPGSILPTEMELADRYQTTRGVVREAIKRLEVHKLVRPVRKKGTVVLDPCRSLSPEVLRVMLIPRPNRVDPQMLRNLLEIKELIDVAMAGFAAERRTEDDVADLKLGLEALEAGAHSPRAYSEAVDLVGAALSRASGNRIFEMLVTWYRHVVGEVEDLIMLARIPTPARRTGARHLVEAIERRDADTARFLMREHHRIAAASLLSAFGKMSPEGE